jgi:putative transposase
MPSIYYNRNFKSRYFYHIINRGAYKKNIFKSKNDYQTFIDILSYYLLHPQSRQFGYQKIVNKFKVRNLKETVHLVSYCLMPNHFHLLLKQLPSATNKTNISNLMRRVMVTYAMYFQDKHKHAGAIFQGRYKNVVVDSNEQLLHLSKYIHLNPQKLINKLTDYSYSSFPAFINQVITPNWLHPKYVLKLETNYKQYIMSPINDEDANKIKSLTLE